MDGLLSFLTALQKAGAVEIVKKQIGAVERKSIYLTASDATKMPSSGEPHPAEHIAMAVLRSTGSGRNSREKECGAVTKSPDGGGLPGLSSG